LGISTIFMKIRFYCIPNDILKKEITDPTFFYMMLEWLYIIMWLYEKSGTVPVTALNKHAWSNPQIVSIWFSLVSSYATTVCIIFLFSFSYVQVLMCKGFDDVAAGNFREYYWNMQTKIVFCYLFHAWFIYIFRNCTAVFSSNSKTYLWIV